MALVVAFGLLIFIWPAESQKVINAWLENIESNSMVTSNQTLPDFKVIGPAGLGSNFSQ